jgi:prepilin-type N-terminal cleavage/methylation domain-containing protein
MRAGELAARCSSGPRSRGGVTLIEVLLAVAILGFGFAVLLTAATRCLAVMKISRNYQEAQWALGMGEAAHPIPIPIEDIEDLDVEEQTLDNGFTFARKVDVEAEEAEEPRDNLYLVRTRVTWKGHGDRENVEEVVRYVYFPEGKTVSTGGGTSGSSTPGKGVK